MNEKGFTLLEVLVSLVVGAMLLSAIGWVIGGLAKDLKVAERPLRAEEILDLSQLLEKMFVEARFADNKDDPLPRSSDKIAFRMYAPQVSGLKGYLDAQLSVTNRGDGAVLFIAFPGTQLPPTQLIDGAKTIEFSYVEKSNDQGLGPFIERITLAVHNEGETKPDMIHLYPRIDAVGACIFDPISQQCRT